MFAAIKLMALERASKAGYISGSEAASKLSIGGFQVTNDNRQVLDYPNFI